VSWVEFQRDEASGDRQSTGEPDGAVSAKGANFEDSSCVVNASQKMKKLALIGCDVDCGKSGFGVCLDRFFQGAVRVNECVGEEFVD